MKFSRQEYWSKLPLEQVLPSGDPQDPGIEPGSPMSPALAGGFFIIGLPGKPQDLTRICYLQMVCFRGDFFFLWERGQFTFLIGLTNMSIDGGNMMKFLE